MVVVGRWTPLKKLSDFLIRHDFKLCFVFVEVSLIIK